MSRIPRGVWAVAIVALFANGSVFAHNFIGLEHPALVRARLQSPNAALSDFPQPIAGTDLSVVCFGIRNSGAFDSRITAIGIEVPGERTGYTLVAPTGSSFRLVENVTRVPGLRDVTLDFALLTGRTFGGGRPGSGLAASTDLSTFCVSGPFPRDMPIERLLDGGVMRLQRVGMDGELGDVAVWESRPR
jgi:hypothetical protein